MALAARPIPDPRSIRVSSLAQTPRISPLGILAVSRARIDDRAPLEQPAAKVLVERGPARLAAGVVADLAAEGVDLGVEAVQIMERDRLQRHGHLGTAELVRPVMADDHMLEPQEQ